MMETQAMPYDHRGRNRWVKGRWAPTIATTGPKEAHVDMAITATMQIHTPPNLGLHDEPESSQAAFVQAKQ